MNYVVLNGINSTTINGLLIQSLPPISKPLMRTQRDEIDGRDGDVVTKLGYSAYDKQISIGLYGDFDIDEIIAYFDSEGVVTFSNEPDKYYYYKILDQIDYERLIRFRTATVTMHCQPFKYKLNEEPQEAEAEVYEGDAVSFDNGGYISELTAEITPKQSGAGDPSPSNIRPITGWTGANIYNDPKYAGMINWNQLVENGNFSDGTTGWSNTSAQTSLSAQDNVLKIDFVNTTTSKKKNARRSFNAPNGHKMFVSFDARFSGSTSTYFLLSFSTSSDNGDKRTGVNIKDNEWTTEQNILTMDADYTVLTIGTNSSTASGDYAEYRNVFVCDLTAMFGAGNEPATVADFIALFPKSYYEYNAGTQTCVSAVNGDPYGLYPISWQTEAGTIYGGTLDVKTGVLTITHQVVTITGGCTNTSVAYSKYKVGDIGYINTDLVSYCNMLTRNTSTVGNARVNQYTLVNSVAYGGAFIYLKLFDTDFASQTACTTATNNKLAEWNTNGTPLIIVFGLATPITVQLSATEVTTLLGQKNNIWADTGTITLTETDGLLKITNEGNTISRPRITLEGGGAVTISVNGLQVFTINFGDYDSITIDGAEMEAYNGGVLLNRLVVGDYDKFVFRVGSNDLLVDGAVTQITVENYSRWI